MTTREQALEAAHRWINGALPAEGARPVHSHEFEHGWVVWPEPPPVHVNPFTAVRRAPEEIGAACAVVDRLTGALTVWPSVPVPDVVRMYRDFLGAGDYDPALPPATGAGARAALRYRDALGEVRTLVVQSATGLPHPALRAAEQLREQGVPAEDVLGLHTDLRPAALPGGYARHALAAALPGVRITHDLAYGPWFDGRAEAVRAVPAPEGVRPNRVPFPRSVPPAQPESGRPLAERLAARFGPEGVRRFDAAAVEHADLPEAVARPLLEVGLPVAVEGFFALHHPEPDGVHDGTRTDLVLPDAAARLAEAGRGTRATADARQALLGQVVLGTDGWALITVDTLQGRVRAIDPDTAAARYCNADVTAFARCLVLLAERLPALRGLHPYAAGPAVAELQWALAAVDRTVFTDPENWWAVIVEQLWHGLL
ncbi:SUKH-4 family immunity protein [Kitasatospora arboriphila]|uniref:Nucleic acid/nucleotide deaminase of polymorphic system toxin n=1 Tax=Kitasatospora arboriphila TaxID=258052 RepID=A0ABN1U9F6_9ACTN